MASCAAVLSSNNAPLFVLSDEEDVGGNLTDHYSLHQSLDVIDEKNNLASASSSSSKGGHHHQSGRELYLGTLFTTEKKKVFGYVTNTRIKFVIVVDASNTSLRDNEIRQMFRRLHLAYTQLVCNPFYVPGERIGSKRFEQVVRGIMVAKRQ